MARPASWPPRLLRHKSGRARAHWNGRDYWFGKHGTRGASERYGEWVRAGPPETKGAKARKAALTVAEALDLYDAFADGHYRHPDGRPTSEIKYVRRACGLVLECCPAARADEFRGKKLKEIREKMVALGWCRTNVNHHVNVIKRVWKWLASEELVSGECHASLRAVEALKRGRTDAPERPKVKPAPIEHVEAALPWLSPHLEVAARLQLLTACRPGEALALDPAEIERREGVWLWRPASHKTSYAGRVRLILVGPKAQALLAPLLADHAGGVLFSPARSEALRRARVRSGSETPRRTCLAGRYDLAGQYDGIAYAKGVRRACDAAQVPRWSPNQLRHSAASFLAAEFGPVVAQTILGHANLRTTEVYAERDLAAALAAVNKVG